MAKYYLGIDQGTTGVTALLFDRHFVPIARGYREISQYYPAPGLSEHDPIQLYDAVCDATAAAMRTAGAAAGDIIAIGIDHEGESAMLWDKTTGKPVYPAIVWQDRRTAERAKELADTHGALFRERTALTPDSYFSATKLEWLLRHVPEARRLQKEDKLLAGNMDAWILWNMTGHRAHKTDASTASRTLLYNIETGAWDKELCDICGIDPKILPEVGDSMRRMGESDPKAFLGIKAPVTALLNDQQAALLGQGCVEKGMLKTTYGTGCFMLMHTGTAPIRSKNGLLTTVAWQREGQREYALDGGVYTAGSATQWLRDGLKIITSAKESGPLALSVKDNGGVYFVPAFTGLAAPHWDPYASGMMIGLNGGTTRAHIVRATSESIAYQVADLAVAMERDAGTVIRSMRCDGGATGDPFLMQFQADILNIPLEVPAFREATAQGSALAAAITLGDATPATARSLKRECKRYEPKMSREERETLLCQWHRAVERAKDWRRE
ncbi:MAG: glycerol kinase GlpK [Ruminococcaceae bacterium]|nr:glycerol kinase GlpK [Oscillospiraceae bacterium]